MPNTSRIQLRDAGDAKLENTVEKSVDRDHFNLLQ
jgi:hypothetical protein